MRKNAFFLREIARLRLTSGACVVYLCTLLTHFEARKGKKTMMTGKVARSTKAWWASMLAVLNAYADDYPPTMTLGEVILGVEGFIEDEVWVEALLAARDSGGIPDAVLQSTAADYINICHYDLVNISPNEYVSECSQRAFAPGAPQDNAGDVLPEFRG